MLHYVFGLDHMKKSAIYDLRLHLEAKSVCHLGGKVFCQPGRFIAFQYKMLQDRSSLFLRALWYTSSLQNFSSLF